MALFGRNLGKKKKSDKGKDNIEDVNLDDLFTFEDENSEEGRKKEETQKAEGNTAVKETTVSKNDYSTLNRNINYAKIDFSKADDQIQETVKEVNNEDIKHKGAKDNKTTEEKSNLVAKTDVKENKSSESNRHSDDFGKADSKKKDKKEIKAKEVLNDRKESTNISVEDETKNKFQSLNQQENVKKDKNSGISEKKSLLTQKTNNTIDDNKKEENKKVLSDKLKTKLISKDGLEKKHLADSDKSIGLLDNDNQERQTELITESNGEEKESSTKITDEDETQKEISDIGEIKDFLVETFNVAGKEISGKGKELIKYLKSHKKLTIVFGILIVLMVLFFIVLLSPHFRVKQINISGNNVVGNDEILKMVDLEYDDFLFGGVSGNIIDILKLDYGKTEKKIKEDNPYIEDIKIHASFPSEINIEVTERDKVAHIKIPDGYLAIDSEGIIVEMYLSDKELSQNVPLICGLEVTTAINGEKVVIKDDYNYKKALLILGAVLATDVNRANNDLADKGYLMFENFKELRFTPGGDIFLAFKLPDENMIYVKLNSINNINDDIIWLSYAINSGALNNLKKGVLDMTGDEPIYR